MLARVGLNERGPRQLSETWTMQKLKFYDMLKTKINYL